MDRKHMTFSRSPRCKTPKRKDRKSPVLTTSSSSSNGSILAKNSHAVVVSEDSISESDKGKGNSSTVLRSLSNVLRKSNEAIVPEAKKTTLKRFASLFKTKRTNDKVPMSSVGISPRGFKAVLSHTQLTKMNESGLAMAVKLPSGATSKILDVTVELEPASSDPESTTSTKKENMNVDLKCAEETDSKTVFVGKMRVSSDTNIRELTQLPLFVVDSQDRLVINPDIKIQSNRSSSARVNSESKSSGVDRKSVQNQSSSGAVSVDEENASGGGFLTPQTVLQMEHSGIEVKPQMINVATQYTMKTGVNKEIDIQASLHATVAQSDSECVIKADKKLLYLRPNLRLVSDDCAGVSSKELLVDRSTSTTTNSSFLEYSDPCRFVFGMPNNSPESYSLVENQNQQYRKPPESEISFVKMKDFEENFSYERWKKENYKSGFFKHVPTTSEHDYKYNMMRNIFNECFDAATNTSTVDSSAPNERERYLIPLSELPRKEIDKTLKLLQSAQKKLLAFVGNDKNIGVKTLPKLNEACRYSTDTDTFSSFPPEERINYIQCFNNPFEEREMPHTDDNSQVFNGERSQNANYYNVKPQGYYTKRPNFYNRFNENLGSIHSQPGYESSKNHSYEKTLSGAFLGDQINTSENHQNLVTASAENPLIIDEDMVSTFNEGLLQEIKIFERLTQEIVDLKRIFEETSSSSSILLEREKNSLNLVESKTYSLLEDESSLGKSLENQGDCKTFTITGEEVPEENDSVRILKLKSEENVDDNKNPFLTSDTGLVNETPQEITLKTETKEDKGGTETNNTPIISELNKESPKSSDQPSLDSNLVYSETSSDVSESSCDQKNLCEKPEKNLQNETLILRCDVNNKWPGLEEELKEMEKPLKSVLPASKSSEIVASLIDNLLVNIDNQQNESNFLSSNTEVVKEVVSINSEVGLSINNNTESFISKETQLDVKETTSGTSQTPFCDVLVSESTECAITKTSMDIQTLPTSDFNFNISTQYAASNVNEETTCKVNRILSCDIFIADNFDSLAPKSNNVSQTTSSAIKNENLGTQHPSPNDLTCSEANAGITTLGTTKMEERGEDFVLKNTNEYYNDIESTLTIQSITNKYMDHGNSENLGVLKPNILKASKMNSKQYNPFLDEIRKSMYDLRDASDDDQCSEGTIESNYSLEQQYSSGSRIFVSNKNSSNHEEVVKKEDTDVAEKEEQIEDYKYDLEDRSSYEETVDTNEENELVANELSQHLKESRKSEPHLDSEEEQKEPASERKIDTNIATMEQKDELSGLQKSDFSYEEPTVYDISDYYDEDDEEITIEKVETNEYDTIKNKRADEIRNDVTVMLESVLNNALNRHTEAANEEKVEGQSGDFAVNNNEEGEGKGEDIHKYIYGCYATHQQRDAKDAAFPEDLINFEDNADVAATSSSYLNSEDKRANTEVEKEATVDNVENTYLSEDEIDELIQKDVCNGDDPKHESSEPEKMSATLTEQLTGKQQQNDSGLKDIEEPPEHRDDLEILNTNNAQERRANEERGIVIMLTPSLLTDVSSNQDTNSCISNDLSAMSCDGSEETQSYLDIKEELDPNMTVIPTLDSMGDLKKNTQNIMLDVIEELNSDVSLVSKSNTSHVENAKNLNNLIELSDRAAFSKSDDSCDKNVTVECSSTIIKPKEDDVTNKKEEKEEFNKTYQSVEKDIITMMQELLKESNDIKETVVLNGAEEDKTPPFVSVDISEEKAEDICKTIVLDLIDMVLINVDSKIDEIKVIDKEKAETTCLDASNKTPSGDATVEIKVSENILGEKNCTTVSELGPIEHKEFLTNTQPVYFCSPVSTNKITSRIPKTSWSFGETSVHQDNRKSYVPTKNNSRKFWMSKGDDKLLDSLEKCSDLFMNLFSELCCHSPIVQMNNNIRNANSENINKTCIEGDCDTPPNSDNKYNMKKSQPFITRHQKLTDLKNPTKLTPPATTSKKGTRTTDEEELLVEDNLTPVVLSNASDYYTKVCNEDEISAKSSKASGSRRTRISYISSSSSSEEIYTLSSARSSKKQKLEIKRSISGQLAVLKKHIPDIKVWAKGVSEPSESSSVTSTDKGYEVDRDSFSLPFPEPKYRYNSLHELNTPEEIAAIESNVLANDRLERRAAIVLERVGPGSPIFRKFSSSDDAASFEISSDEINDEA